MKINKVAILFDDSKTFRIFSKICKKHKIQVMKHISIGLKKDLNIKTQLRLIKQELNTVKNNHLFHLEKKVDFSMKILWTVGVLVFSNLLILLRDVIL